MTSGLPNLLAGGAGRRIRVLIVDDSAVIRKLVTQALDHDPAIEVVGTAYNGVAALQKIPQTNPDVVTLDVEMPEMDGIEALRRIRAAYPAIRVIMFSTLTERGAAVTIDALTLGASDYITKTSQANGSESAVEALRHQLVPKIKQFFHLHAPPAVLPQTSLAPSMLATQPSSSLAAPAARPVVPEVLAIGVSTGGPTALHDIIPSIGANFPLPILIVQHMPPLFTKLLADRLSAKANLPIEEARNGQLIEAGRIYIAPGDYHVRAAGQVGRPKIALDQGPQENSCRPAVDVLFRSVAQLWGAAAIGVVLTGMGSDGLLGCEMLRAKGAYIVAQDEATSVVWGMPGFVAKAGLADKVLPLDKIIPDVTGRCQIGLRGMFKADAMKHSATR